MHIHKCTSWEKMAVGDGVQWSYLLLLDAISVMTFLGMATVSSIVHIIYDHYPEVATSRKWKNAHEHSSKQTVLFKASILMLIDRNI